MTTYRVAGGYNIALGSLTVLSPQPRSEGIKYGARRYSGNGSIYDENPFIELEWDVLETTTEYQAIIDIIFGVTRPKSNEITIYLRNEYYAWVRMNGIAVSPEPGKDARYRQYFPRDLTIVVKSLVIAS
jgi:hypothetical protein